jgi:hypothetical protein
MSYETLYELLHRAPFEPFVIHLSNGEEHAVKHPECALLMKSRIIVGNLETDRTTIIALLHINSISELQPAG